jgi:hypothetical protein
MIVLVFGPSDYRPEVRLFDGPPSRQSLQDVVGSDIEVIPGFDSIVHDRAFYPCVAFCDSDGERHHLPINNWASALWHSALLRQGREGLRRPDGSIADWLVGTEVVVYREEDARAGAASLMHPQALSEPIFVPR